MTRGSNPFLQLFLIALVYQRLDIVIIDVFLMSDAAILASIALQYGAPLDEIMHALKRDARGIAASPIGAALDAIR